MSHSQSSTSSTPPTSESPDNSADNWDQSAVESDRTQTKDDSPQSDQDSSDPNQYLIETWDDIEIPEKILRGIFGYGFEAPSPIQKKALGAIFSGKDVVAQAQSGTGKTAAFAIGALNKIDLSLNATQIVVLSPTKELTIQTAAVIRSLGSMMEGLRVQELFGGCASGSTNSFNRTHPHIICGCPGKVYDMISRHQLSCHQISMIILDEADELLSSGFLDQIFNIFRYFENSIQVVLISATLPPQINDIVERLTQNPVRVEVKAEMLTLQGIEQYYVKVDDDMQKYETVKHIFGFISLSQSIIYCNSIKRVTDLYDAMKDDGFPVCCLHSGMDREERADAFNQFKTGAKRVLISSNVTARGIDIQQVSTVINFDIPRDVHTYLHRIGRSGRWGRKGVGINFVCRDDVHAVKNIEAHYQTQMVEMPDNLENLQKC